MKACVAHVEIEGLPNTSNQDDKNGNQIHPPRQHDLSKLKFREADTKGEPGRLSFQPVDAIREGFVRQRPVRVRENVGRLEGHNPLRQGRKKQSGGWRGGGGCGFRGDC